MNPLILAPTTLLHTEPLAFLKAAAEAGYDGVGLRLYRSPSLPYFPVLGDRRLIRDMKAVIAAHNLSVLDIFSFYLLPQTNVADFIPALELAQQFSARYAIVQGDDPDWARLCDNFSRFCEAADRCGLVAAIEFMPARQLASLQQALRLLVETGSPNVAILVDPLHLMRSGAAPDDLARLDPVLFPYAQISDGILAPGEPDVTQLGRMGGGTRRMIGEGSLPLREIFAALQPGLPLSVEVLPDDSGASPLAWARKAMEASRRFLSA